MSSSRLQRRTWAADGTALSPPSSSAASSFTGGGSCNDLQRFVLGLNPMSSFPSLASVCAAPSPLSRGCSPPRRQEPSTPTPSVAGDEAATCRVQEEPAPACSRPTAADNNMLRSRSLADLSLWSTSSTDPSRRQSESLWSSLFSFTAGAPGAAHAPGLSPAGKAPTCSAPGVTPSQPGRAALMGGPLGAHAGSQPWAVNPGSQWMCYK